MPTPNDLSSIYMEYRERPDAENTSALFAHLRVYSRRIVRGWKTRLAYPDEVTEQIVASAWASMQTFSGRSSFSTWVHTIARRKIIDAIRRSSSSPQMTTDDRLATTAPPVSDAPLLDTATLAALNDDERHLVQRLIEQPDYDALAQSLCISRIALIRRLQRIFEKCERERSKDVAMAD